VKANPALQEEALKHSVEGDSFETLAADTEFKRIAGEAPALKEKSPEA
jgi:hypothetical protein